MDRGNGLAQLYARHMACHPYGIPLYKPVSSKILKPGTCGYLDALGEWTPIVDLTSAESLQEYGLAAPTETLKRISAEESTTWGPKVSQNVAETRVDLSAGLDAALSGLPLTASAASKFRTTSNFGAVLVTTPPIQRDGFYHESIFKAWFQNNLKALMASPRADEIVNHNIIIVASVYTTAKCSLAAWTEPSRHVALGFNVGASGLGKIGPGCKWFDTGSAGGWNRHEGVNGDRLVVFCSGITFKTMKLMRIVRSKVIPSGSRYSMHRKAEPEYPTEESFTIGAPDEEGFDVHCTTYAGKDLSGDDDESEYEGK